MWGTECDVWITYTRHKRVMVDGNQTIERTSAIPSKGSYSLAPRLSLSLPRSRSLQQIPLIYSTWINCIHFFAHIILFGTNLSSTCLRFCIKYNRIRRHQISSVPRSRCAFETRVMESWGCRKQATIYMCEIEGNEKNYIKMEWKKARTANVIDRYVLDGGSKVKRCHHFYLRTYTHKAKTFCKNAYLNNNHFIGKSDRIW